MTNYQSTLLYQIALSMVPGIGSILGKKLMEIFGSPDAIFRESSGKLLKIKGIGTTLSTAFGDKKILQRAELEVRFVEQYRISTMFFQDEAYPRRLKHCVDGPLLLYYKGTDVLNAEKTLGMVGTRSATRYGKQASEEIVKGLKDHNPLIISGLAYGIDASAHRNALEHGLSTVAVLGHGLDRIYPFVHTSMAEKIVRQGGLITEFPHGTNPDRENFPKRNRILAGLCDAVVVVEAGQKGGALITAELANSYNRDVFAVPGRIGDPWSAGANYLIRTNQAHLVESPKNIAYIMGWSQKEPESVAQKKIFVELSADESCIVQVLQERDQCDIDELMLTTKLTPGQLSAALLHLEFEDVITVLPGKQYQVR
jgi:DNA processing protein